MSTVDLVFFAVITPCVIYLGRQVSRYLRHGKISKKWHAYEDLIIKSQELEEEINKLEKLMPEFRRTDELLKSFSGKDFDALELLARRAIATFRYNKLCERINEICDDSIYGEQKLRNLLPECIAADFAVKSAFGGELPEDFVYLEHIVRAELADGDIGEYALA